MTNPNRISNSTYTLSLLEINSLLDNISNQTLMKSTNDSFLMVQPPRRSNNTIVLGASFTRGVGGQIIQNTNEDSIINSPISTAAIISASYSTYITSLNMFIIGHPATYRSVDNVTNKTLASSIIVASAIRNLSYYTPIQISLYFQVIDEWKPNITGIHYLCSYYDTDTFQWDETGCTTPLFNTLFNRYECTCNHLTSFALLWLPNIPLTSTLTAQDIASLVFESLSIVCFLCVILHAIIIRLRDPLIGLQTYDLLPLISTASTTILFIFHIALAMTVYTNTISQQQTHCFQSASVLMFFVYFFLIFMFCGKTSVGYFNYLRFVRLFPQPSFRKLFIMLIISFFISITFVAFAIGFNSNASFAITQLYPYKLCWFTRQVIYYFLTIPVCLFLLINIVLFVAVAVHIIDHVRHATSPHQSYERMKRCVIVLLSSCLTQGIGWMFGPFLTFVSPSAGEVLGWFFVVFNGLEGFFSIVLYILLRMKHMDETKRTSALRALRTSTTPQSDPDKKTLTTSVDSGRSDQGQTVNMKNYKKQGQISHRPNTLDDWQRSQWPVSGTNNKITSSF